MQEISLYGQVEDYRRNQVLSVLAGLTASNPRSHLERHVICFPARIPAIQEMFGGSQKIAPERRQQAAVPSYVDITYMQLVKQIKRKDFGASVTLDDARSGWSQNVYITPDPSKTEASVRTFRSIDIEKGNPIEVMVGADYKYVRQYVVEGHEFVLDNIAFYLHRLRRFPNLPAASIDEPLPKLEEMPLLDKSGSWLLRAMIITENGTPSLISQAITELERLKTQLEGFVDLGIPDRMALDTRVRPNQEAPQVTIG